LVGLIGQVQLTDRDPEGIAWGLVAAYRSDDREVLRPLLVAGSRPGVVGAVLCRLAELAAPHQLDFDAAPHQLDFDAAPHPSARVEFARVTGLVLAVGTGLDEVRDQLVATIGGESLVGRAQHLAVAAQLVAGLVDADRVSAPLVRFERRGSS